MLTSEQQRSGRLGQRFRAGLSAASAVALRSRSTVPLQHVERDIPVRGRGALPRSLSLLTCSGGARSPRGQDRRRPGRIDFEGRSRRHGRSARPAPSARPGHPGRPLGDPRGRSGTALAPVAGHCSTRQAGASSRPQRTTRRRQAAGRSVAKPSGQSATRYSDAQVHVVDLQLRYSRRVSAVPGRVRLPANAVHAGLPRPPPTGSPSLGRQRAAADSATSARSSAAERPAPASMAVLVAGGGARVLRRDHLRCAPRSAGCAARPRCARAVGQQVPAGPAGQQRGLPRPRVGDRGRCPQAAARSTCLPSREAPPGPQWKSCRDATSPASPPGGEPPGRQRVSEPRQAAGRTRRTVQGVSGRTRPAASSRGDPE